MTLDELWSTFDDDVKELGTNVNVRVIHHELQTLTCDMNSL